MAALGPESAPASIDAEKATIDSDIRPLDSASYPKPNGHSSQSLESKVELLQARLASVEGKILELEKGLTSLQPSSEQRLANGATADTPNAEPSKPPAAGSNGATPKSESITAKLAATLDFNVEEVNAKYRLERDKRLRKDGNEQYKEFKGQFAHFLDDPYVKKVERESLDVETDFLVLGGGFGGLCLGAEFVKAGISNFKMIDKAGDYGGTWYWGRYPGAACDVESYIYMPLLEETGYIPTEKYAKAPELLAHSRRIGEHYGLYEKTIFHTEVREMRWDETSTRWIVSTDRGDKIRARFVASASGPLNMPKLPGVEGIEKFKGHSFHTSRWDYDYTGGTSHGNLEKLADKRVAYIGTGATAIQAIPHLGAGVQMGDGKLYVFQRTPSGVSWRDNRPTDPSWSKELKPGWQAERQDNFLRVMSGSQEEDLVSDGWTRFSRWLKAQGLPRTQSMFQEFGQLLELADMQNMDTIRKRCSDVIKDQKTAEALKPWYRQFCKRPCFHDEFLDTFNLSNVELVDTDGKGIERITENGIVANGVEYPLDLIIYGTGYEVGTSYARRSNFEIYGRNGETLTEHFKDGAKTLHGFWVDNFPNLFLISILQSAYSANFVHSLSRQAVHIAWLVKYCQDHGIVQIEATEEATTAWTDTIVKSAGFMLEFRKSCTPGYYNNEGQLSESLATKRSASFAPGPIAFFKLLEDWRTKGSFEGLQFKDGQGNVVLPKEKIEENAEGNATVSIANGTKAES